jgi:hypothetical protein
LIKGWDGSDLCPIEIFFDSPQGDKSLSEDISVLFMYHEKQQSTWSMLTNVSGTAPKAYAISVKTKQQYEGEKTS